MVVAVTMILSYNFLGDRAFQVASPGLWNGLPNDIRNAKTMDVFKSLVKTHHFRKAYACYF